MSGTAYRRTGALAGLGLGLIAATTLAAQAPAAGPDARRPARDTAGAPQPPRGDSVRPRPPITPTGAFLRSLVLPGWGQARLQRNVTAGVFLTFEGLCVTMVWKANWQLDYARERGKYVTSHTQERQDWIALLVFNHLVAAAEAYVSAHLYDFPAALQTRALPGGRTGVGVAVPF